MFTKKKRIDIKVDCSENVVVIAAMAASVAVFNTVANLAVEGLDTLKSGTSAVFNAVTKEKNEVKL